MTEWGGRLMNSWRGAQLGWSGAYDFRALTPHRDVSYGDFNARLARYCAAEAYYNNTVYDALDGSSSRLKQDERLYKFIRGIENPVKQENNLIVSYTFRGSVDTNSLTGGCMPLRFDNKALEEPIRKILKWSMWEQHIGELPQGAAMRGDTGIWTTVDRVSGRVRMEVVDPARIKLVERDHVGNVKSAVIEYSRDEQPDVERYVPGRFGSMQMIKTKSYVYTLKVTGDGFQTFKDGKPFAFFADDNGDLVDAWPNIYGFVPLKLGYYALGQDGWGQNSFFGTVRRQIDEINDQVSIVNDSTRIVIAPIVTASNVSSADEIHVVREDKDSMAIVYLSGDNSTLTPLTIPLDLAGAISNYTNLKNSLKKNMPILALQEVRDMGGNLSGVAIERSFGDAISQILQVRKNLNPIITGALQMAVTMGAIEGFEGFGAFTAESFDNGDMDLGIADYSVIDDTLSRSEKVDKLVSVADLPMGSKRKALIEIGYTDDDVAEIIEEDQAEKEESNRNAVRGFAQGLGMDDNQDVTDLTDPEDIQNVTDTQPPQLQKEAA